ncbi:MAG: glycogen synthase, partial [Phycisphaerae bacterium]
MFLSADEEASAHLFEVAWEVCAQVGGIYTVVRSKAPDMLAEWGERYHLVGPYDGRRTEAEFERLEPDGVTGAVLAAMRSAGVQCHYGRWLVAGYPRVILLDYAAHYDQL